MRFGPLLALRNLARRKTRTALTFSMTAVGTALIVFMMGLSEGTYADLTELATSSWAGHFQITAKGYNDKPSLFKLVREPEKLAAELSLDKRVAATTPRVETAGLIALGQKTTGALFAGVDPLLETRVTTVNRLISGGGWLPERDGEEKAIILGLGLAEKLGAKLGDEVSFVGQAADGSIAAELFRVRGILESGSPELDASLAIFNIHTAWPLLSLEGRAHRIVGRFTDIEDADGPAPLKILPENLEYLSWREVVPSLDKSIRADRTGVRIFIGILLAVVILGVANTMMMAVMERTHEFGVMAALGASPYLITLGVLWEAAWLILLGAGAGIAAGSAVNHYTGIVGIPLPAEEMAFGGVTMKAMHPRNTLSALLGAPAIVFLAGMVAGLLPALKAANLSPAAALRKRN